MLLLTEDIYLWLASHFLPPPIICRPEHRAAAAWGLGVEAVPDREVEEGGVGGELWVSQGQCRTVGAAPVPGSQAGSCCYV